MFQSNLFSDLKVIMNVIIAARTLKGDTKGILDFALLTSPFAYV